MKNQTKRLVRIFTPFAALVLSVGSLTTAAYAWFTFTMSGNSDVTSITVKGGASLAMKYYDENITVVGGETSQSGYDFYRKPSATGTCDYSTNFISTAIGTAITIDNTSPRAACSYAFEITNASKTYVDLYINDYSCTTY